MFNPAMLAKMAPMMMQGMGGQQGGQMGMGQGLMDGMDPEMLRMLLQRLQGPGAGATGMGGAGLGAGILGFNKIFG